MIYYIGNKDTNVSLVPGGSTPVWGQTLTTATATTDTTSTTTTTATAAPKATDDIRSSVPKPSSTIAPWAKPVSDDISGSGPVTSLTSAAVAKPVVKSWADDDSDEDDDEQDQMGGGGGGGGHNSDLLNRGRFLPPQDEHIRASPAGPQSHAVSIYTDMYIHTHIIYAYLQNIIIYFLSICVYMYIEC